MGPGLRLLTKPIIVMGFVSNLNPVEMPGFHVQLELMERARGILNRKWG